MVKSDEIVDTNSARILSFSTDDIYRGGDSNRCLSDDLNTIEGNITALQNGKADTNHTHSGYLSEDDAVTTFAAINHTHTGYATASHTHSTYLPLSGGSLTGNLNVGGIFRVNNQQSVYDDGSMITLSTNNRQTMIAGSKIYSKQTINVSSDERLKENIEFADPEECTEFINSLGVKTFNYIGDDTPCIGVIAQDLQDSEFGKFFVCKQPGEEGYLAVKAADLVFPLIAAVQNLSAEVDYLKAMI